MAGHGVLVGVHIDNLLVHLEEVAIFLFHHIASQTLDGIGKVKVDSQTCGADAVAGIATLFGGTGGHIAGHQVAESGIAAFQIVVAILFGDVIGTLLAATDGLGILLLLGHPDAAIVAEALTHQRQLGLVVAVDGDAGGVNLHIAGVGKSGAFLVAHPGGGAVAVHGIGGEVVDIAIATCGKHDGMGGIALEVTSDKVAGDDAACATVDNDELHHLVAFMQFDTAAGNLTAQRTVGTEEELLAGLAAGVEGAADLRAAEGAVVEQSAIVAGKGNALSHTLVDDGTADLGQTVDVGLAGAVVTTLDGVAEQTLYTVAVVLIVLGGIDATLGSNGVGATGGILNTENIHVVEAHGSQRGGGGSTGKARAHHDDVNLALVGRIHQLLTGFVVGPFF